MNEDQARARALQDYWEAGQTYNTILPGEMPPEGTGFGDYWRANLSKMGPPVGPPRYVSGPAGVDVPVYWAFVQGVYRYRPGEGVSPL